jgi:hypothetical protein
MKKNLLIGCITLLATLGSVTSATAQSLPGLDCEDDSGGDITITYGVSPFSKRTVFEVKEKVEVRKGKALIFRLKLKDGREDGTAGLENAMVRIKGKEGTGSDWFTLIEGSYSGTADQRHRIGICADTVAGDYEYQYEISIEGFGMLDPRVIVIPN